MTKLLIVDDENHLIESMMNSIPWESAGIEEVVGVYSAHEALSMLEEKDFDIVITDVKMPEMDGLELTGIIKQRWKYIKCILLSGYAEFELVKSGLRNEASDYLLKPVRDEVLLERIRELIAVQQQEKEQERAYLDSKAFLHQSLPILRSKLLNDLVYGAEWTIGQLREQLVRYEIGIRVGDSVSLLLIRIEPEEGGTERTDERLMVFALTNIMGELLAEGYEGWSGEDLSGHLLFVARRKDGDAEAQPLDRIADHLQRIVRRLYKLTVSVLIYPEAAFPGQLQRAYHQCVASIRQWIGDERDTIVTVGKEWRSPEPSVLSSLYRLPMFGHLLETGQWEAARGKLEEIAEEWSRSFNGSYEHLIEIYHSLSAAFFHLIHKNGRRMTDYRLASGNPVRSLKELRTWALELIAGLEAETQDDLSHHRNTLVIQVQQYVQEHLASDLSLQAIADTVHMHPVYLSKVYKSETGENITDYVFRLRMEKAVSLLNVSDRKVYEIAEQVGYNNPAYFIRVFKNHFKVTPQEYRSND